MCIPKKWRRICACRRNGEEMHCARRRKFQMAKKRTKKNMRADEMAKKRIVHAEEMAKKCTVRAVKKGEPMALSFASSWPLAGGSWAAATPRGRDLAAEHHRCRKPSTSLTRSKLVAQEAHAGLCLQSASCAAVQTVCSEATRVQDLAISGAWRSTDRSLQ